MKLEELLAAQDYEAMGETRKWDIRFMKLAEHVAQWSKDPSTKVGAVVTSDRKVLGLGYNGFPAGTDDSSDLYDDRSVKYPRVVHAEMNALLQSNRLLAQESMTLYATLFSCADCAGPIINFGVKRAVFPYPDNAQLERWGDSHTIAAEMYQEAGVVVNFLN